MRLLPKHNRTRWTVVVLVTVVALSLGTGATTYALYQDSADASGTVRAADNFGFPDDAVAYDDANGNDQWDGSEPTYTATDLQSLSDGSVNLRFHEKNGKQVTVQGDITVDVNSIEAGTDVTLEGDNIQLYADQTISLSGLRADDRKSIRTVEIVSTTDGVDLSGATIDVGTRITIDARGADADISGADLRSGSQLYVYADTGNAILTKKTKCQASQIVVRDQDGSQNDCSV